MKPKLRGNVSNNFFLAWLVIISSCNKLDHRTTSNTDLPGPDVETDLVLNFMASMSVDILPNMKNADHFRAINPNTVRGTQVFTDKSINS